MGARSWAEKKKKRDDEAKRKKRAAGGGEMRGARKCHQLENVLQVRATKNDAKPRSDLLEKDDPASLTTSTPHLSETSSNEDKQHVESNGREIRCAAPWSWRSFPLHAKTASGPGMCRNCWNSHCLERDALPGVSELWPFTDRSRPFR